MYYDVLVYPPTLKVVLSWGFLSAADVPLNFPGKAAAVTRYEGGGLVTQMVVFFGIAVSPVVGVRWVVVSENVSRSTVLIRWLAGLPRCSSGVVRTPIVQQIALIVSKLCRESERIALCGSPGHPKRLAEGAIFVGGGHRPVGGFDQRGYVTVPVDLYEISTLS